MTICLERKKKGNDGNKDMTDFIKRTVPTHRSEKVIIQFSDLRTRGLRKNINIKTMHRIKVRKISKQKAYET